MIAARADVTQYIIWHRTNTVPLVRAGHPMAPEILKVDILALADAVDELVRVHWLANTTRALMGVLDRLRIAIRSDRWNRKITLFQVMTEDIANSNQAAARRQFTKLMPVTETEDDVQVLQTCISLHGDELSFSGIISICDHIMRLSRSLAVTMQYTAVKAGRYLLINDVQKAGQLLDQVAKKARDAQREEQGLDLYEEWLFATALSQLGLLKRQPALFDEAIVILKRQLAREGWKPEGAERIHKLIGDCHRYAERWPEAEGAYLAAGALVATPATTIFLAEVVWRQGRIAEAAVILDGLTPEALDRNEYEDLVFAAAAIAVESGDAARMKAAANRLQGFRSTAPYFEQRRLAILIRVNQALSSGSSPKITRSLRRLMATTARSVSRYAILEPNLSGVGLNLNRVLEDLADHLERPPKSVDPKQK